MIAIGTDHRGYRLKETIKQFLDNEGLKYKDFGTYSDNSVDYPDYAKAVCENISSGESDRGILICGSGMGICIPANKYKGIRAANVLNEKMAEMTRRHNDANVICFGADFIKPETAVKCLKVFLNTDFENEERHIRRVNKVNNIIQ
ncbi:MAG: ribose 5-phosphate isomerase B [Ignavibacteria bacterium]|nr:ribose 5-phosphate isomerase B [Ignavibacteria bacterium]